MQQIPFRAQIEGIRKLLRVLLIQILLVSFPCSVSLHLIVRKVRLPLFLPASSHIDVDFPFFGSRDSWQGICMDIEQLLSVFGKLDTLTIVLSNKLTLHLSTKRRQITCLFQALDGRLASAGQQDMPRGEGTNHYANNARYHCEHDVVHWHQGLHILRLSCQLGVHPSSGHGKGVQAEYGGVDEEQQKRLVVAQTDARSKPRAVMVHLQDAFATSATVVRAVGLASLAFLAEAHAAIGLDGEGGPGGGCGRRKGRVATDIRGAAWAREDGGGIAPIEEGVEDDAGNGGVGT